MATASEVNAYNEFCRSVRVLMSVVGLWPKENPSIFYRLRPYCCFTIYLSTIIVVNNAIARHTGNMKSVVPCFGILTVVILSTVKTHCLVTHSRKLLWFHQTVHKLCEEWISDKEITNTILNDTPTIWNILRFYWCLASFSCAMGTLLPLMSFLNKVFHHLQPIKYKPIIPAAYSWNPATSYFSYMLHNIAEILMLTCPFYVGSLTDGMFSLSIHQMVIPLRGMTHRLEHLSPGTNYEQMLHKCICQYAALIKCRNIIQNAYWPVILGTAGTAPLTLCSLLWQVTQMTTIKPFQKIQFATHSLGKAMQVFSYSWSASLLTTQNEQYLNGVYASDWCDNKKHTITVLTMLIQRPLAITVSPAVNLNLSIFLFAMKTAISYYLLLQTLEEKS